METKHAGATSADAVAQISPNWEAIKVLAVALGSVREAAIRSSSTLPDEEQNRFIERVNKRAYRERWLDHSPTILPPATANAKPLSKAVQTASDSLQNALNEDNNSTRLGLSKAARKAAEHFGEQDGKVLVDKDIAQAASHWTRTAAAVHSWQEKGDSGVSLQILNVNGNLTL